MFQYVFHHLKEFLILNFMLKQYESLKLICALIFHMLSTFDQSGSPVTIHPTQLVTIQSTSYCSSNSMSYSSLNQLRLFTESIEAMLLN